MGYSHARGVGTINGFVRRVAGGALSDLIHECLDISFVVPFCYLFTEVIKIQLYIP